MAGILSEARFRDVVPALTPSRTFGKKEPQGGVETWHRPGHRVVPLGRGSPRGVSKHLTIPTGDSDVEDRPPPTGHRSRTSYGQVESDHDARTRWTLLRSLRSL